MSFLRSLRFVWLLTKLRLTRQMVFRLSFFGSFFADGALFLTQMLAFELIYGQVDGIGGWSRGQMMIFIGSFSMLNGLSMLLCFFGLIELPRKIREGGLDLYLTKPGSPLLRICFESVDLGSAPLLLLSGLIIARGAALEGIAVSLPLLLGFIGLLLAMALLYCDMELILRTIPFFVIAADAINHLEGDMLTLNFKIPGVLYKGGFKLLFCFALPYGLMATVPTEALSGVLKPQGLAYALAIVAGFTAFALWFWRLGLKNYKSASS
ncbi:MAG: ABC-2 family transporter protein [Christensenellaceae bacterium]|jgi:ABC-2 type transport system permease protein|nr:ABC-2 family transporter protein [Christensenellaceae bacterium]